MCMAFQLMEREMAEWLNTEGLVRMAGSGIIFIDMPLCEKCGRCDLVTYQVEPKEASRLVVQNRKVGCGSRRAVPMASQARQKHLIYLT
jgi:hypothetical protein